MGDIAVNERIEVVRGRLGGGRADELLRFWSVRGALDGHAARGRLPEVVCLLRDDRGEIAGVNSVYEESLPVIGNRSFWIYRNLLARGAEDAGPAMVQAAFDVLEAEFDPGSPGPIGLCLLVADQALLRRHPEAFWPGSRMLYAGYTRDGRQIRVAYFEDACV